MHYSNGVIAKIPYLDAGDSNSIIENNTANGTGGEGESLVRNYNLGWTVPANNLNQLQLFINELSIDKLKEYRKDAVQKSAIDSFQFEKQFQKLLLEINKIQ